MKGKHTCLSLSILLGLSWTCSADQSLGIVAPFLEQFLADWDQRWKASEAMKEVPSDFSDKEHVDELFRYRGEWAVEEPLEGGVPNEIGLVAKTAAAHHAISVGFKEPIDPTGKDLVIQYDLKLQKGLECGGAYIKLLSEDPSGIHHQEFDDKTPYTIMFGPDRCGSTNKVHFIFRHKNPKTGKIEEKHLRTPPSPSIDSKTHLYTLIIHPDNSFEIKIDNKQTTKGSLLSDFEPPVNPPKEIDDPEDKKPEDWVDEPKIKDVNAVKPDDWDEDAPQMIPDADAVKPDNWLDDETEFIPDPAAEKPEDWDDEEDGEWTAPQIPNAKCEKAAGCGEWKRPQKPNPNYKGKWTAPFIDNPAYKGVWTPRKIANPDYFEDLHPANFNKIMGIGIEIWTMQAGIMYDDFYVGHSVADAEAFAKKTFEKKVEIEKAEEEKKKDAAKEEEKKVEESDSEDTSNWIETIKVQFFKFAALAAEDPVAATKKYPAVGVSLLLLVISPILLFTLLSKSASADPSFAKGEKKKVESSEDENETTEADDEQEDLKPRRRKPNKDE